MRLLTARVSTNPRAMSSFVFPSKTLSWASTTHYSMSGLIAASRFTGIVHGVVVQITTLKPSPSPACSLSPSEGLSTSSAT